MDDINILQRIDEYDEQYCWQYDIRLKNLENDIIASGLSLKEINNIVVADFEFKAIEDKKEKEKAIEFIKRHEWLGTITQYTTHWFGAYYKNNLAGVITMGVPNAFSKMLGNKTKDIERLISRGACISWSPIGLASRFLMWCIRYMVKHTRFRLFTAYSDPTAREVGTIYQACNFYYLGQASGTVSRYINPYTGKIVSDRFFRQKSAYKKYAAELGIEWSNSWVKKTGMNWVNVPDDIEKRLRSYSKAKQSQSTRIGFLPKHKYAYVLGSTKKETKHLRHQFLENNKTYSYPKRVIE